jgi:hypothetical protein
VELTGWNRDYARRALHQALALRPVRARTARPPVYGPRVIEALVVCWAVLRAPAGKRLAPMLPAAQAKAAPRNRKINTSSNTPPNRTFSHEATK